LREARIGVVAAIVAAFGGIISEVGAVMLVGGNIEGKTRVLTTAIVLNTRTGEFSLALALGIILLALAFVANIAMLQLRGRE
jgi:tungstate transport system permease protein